MGVINYSTSDYITMGLRPYNLEDFTDENGVDYDELRFCQDCDYENIEAELDKHDFHYFHIEIKFGYYEGFMLDIENNFAIALDDWKDRRDMNKEITEIKQFLIDCAGFGLVQCFPGWCTGYNDYSGTIKAIKNAIKEMREEARTIPTYTQYIRQQKEKSE